MREREWDVKPLDAWEGRRILCGERLREGWWERQIGVVSIGFLRVIDGVSSFIVKGRRRLRITWGEEKNRVVRGPSEVSCPTGALYSAVRALQIGTS